MAHRVTEARLVAGRAALPVTPHRCIPVSAPAKRRGRSGLRSDRGRGCRGTTSRRGPVPTRTRTTTRPDPGGVGHGRGGGWGVASRAEGRQVSGEEKRPASGPQGSSRTVSGSRRPRWRPRHSLRINRPGLRILKVRLPVGPLYRAHQWAFDRADVTSDADCMMRSQAWMYFGLRKSRRRGSRRTCRSGRACAAARRPLPLPTRAGRPRSSSGSPCE